MNDTIKTKKIKHKNTINKDLWNMFDSEIKNVNEITEDKSIECLYRQCGEREICDCCQSILIVSDEGFLACPNKTCGIIYKDIIDQGAEWRYYGADDNHSIDPTRCGMAINSFT